MKCVEHELTPAARADALLRLHTNFAPYFFLPPSIISVYFFFSPPVFKADIDNTRFCAAAYASLGRSRRYDGRAAMTFGFGHHDAGSLPRHIDAHATGKTLAGWPLPALGALDATSYAMH